MTADDQIAHKLAGRVDRRIGLGDRIFLLLHRRQIGDLLRHLALAHLAIGRLDEPVFVDAREGRERVDEPDVRAFRRLDRADAAIMRRMHVTHLEARPLAREAARPQRGQAPLVGDLGKRVRLIHELRQLRRAEELAHRRGRGFRVDQILRHDGVDLDRRHALLDRPLHAQKPDAILILHQFADRTHAPVAQMVNVVDLAAPVAQVHQRLDDREDVVLAQRALGVGRIEVEAHVHLHPADRREVVALGVEEQRLEHRLGAFDCRRLARTHDAIDVEQGVLSRGILVDLERVADIGADIDVVDVEHRQLLEAGLQELRERLLGNLLAGLGVDLAGRRVVEILGDILAIEIGVAGAQRLQALLGQLAGGAHGQLPAGLDGHFARVGVDEVDGSLDALHALGFVRHAPAVLETAVDDLAIECRQDLFAVEAKRVEQRRHRDLAATVDAGVDDVLGVELDIEPGAAIGDDAGGEQKLARRMALALVVIEKHARTAMHLRDDDALGAVDDEGAVRGHERHVAHVHVLLLDVLDRFGLGLRIDVEHDEAQRHLERRGVGHAPLAALVDVVFRRLVFVLDEFEMRGVGEVLDREHRLEHRLQALVWTSALRRIHQQELVIRGLLDLDQVRHLADFLDVPEHLANALAASECLRHVAPLKLSLAAFCPPSRSSARRI